MPPVQSLRPFTGAGLPRLGEKITVILVTSCSCNDIFRSLAPLLLLKCRHPRASLQTLTAINADSATGAELLDLAEETDLLRKIPMFAKMETSRLKLLAFASEIVSFQHGDIVFNSGDTADYAYVIMEGAVDIITETETGPIVTFTLSQNQLIGELGVLNNTPRIATLIANGKLRAMKITAEMFFRILRENSEVALDVIRMLSDKVTRTNDKLEELQRQVHQQDPK
jgi:CRP/FNR family cyclic AMP-dependent transcriptional regulator